LGVVVLGLALAALGVGLRAWLPTDGGRATVASLFDGRRIGALGTLRIERLTGDPLSQFAIADVALVDDRDVWLRAKDVRVIWAARPLLSRSLEIESIDIRDLTVLRRPEVARRSTRGGDADLAVRIGALRIDRMDASAWLPRLSDPLRSDGALRLARAGDGEARLLLTVRDSPDDALSLRAKWTASGPGVIDIEGAGPAGGAFARALGAEEDQAPRLVLQMQGGLARFDAHADLDLGATRVLSAQMTRKDQAASWTGRLDPIAWPLLGELAQRTGGAIEFSGGATLAPGERWPITLAAAMPAGRVDAAMQLNRARTGLDGPVGLTATDFDLARLADMQGRITARGAADIAAMDQWTWSGVAVARDLDFGIGRARQLEGPVRLSRRDGVISWSGQGVAVQHASFVAAPGLAPDNYRVSAAGDYSLRRRRVEILRGQVDGRPGRVAAQGSWSLRGGELALSGAASLEDLSGLGGLTGAAQGQWTLDRANRDAPMQIGLEGRGRNVGSDNDLARQLIGPAPDFKVSAIVRRGGVIVQSAVLRGGAVDLTVQGQVAGEGAVRAEVRGRLRHKLVAGPVTLLSGSFRGGVAGPVSAPKLALTFANGAASVSGVGIADIAGALDAALDGRRSGRLRLTGTGAGGEALALDASGDLSDGLRLSQARLSLADLTLDLDDLATGPQGLGAHFTTQGSIAGLAGFTGGDIRAGGTLRIGPDDLTIKASGRAASIARGATRLAAADFDIDLGGRTARGKLRIRGERRDRLDLTATLDGAGEGRTWAGGVAVAGQIAGAVIRTDAPLVWSTTAEASEISGALALLGGQLSGRARVGPAAEASLDWTGLDLSAMGLVAGANPVSGVASGSLRFSNPGTGSSTGAVRLNLANLNPAGLKRDPVSISLAGDLRDQALAVRIDGLGQGFRLQASGRAGVRTGQGFDIGPAMDRPLEASLVIDGAVEPLWTLFGPVQQSLRGEASTRVTISGTPAQPTLEGDIALERGSYEHAATGLVLRDIRLNGRFDQTLLNLTGFSARDAGAGTLSGAGELTWTRGLSGDIALQASGLRVLDRDDRMAVVSGTGALDVQAGAVSITGDLVIDDARLSVEQPAVERIPVLPGLRRINFSRVDSTATAAPARFPSPRLDIRLRAPRRVFVFGRGLDTEWGGEVRLRGSTEQPVLTGEARLQRGDLNLAGRRFAFETGTVRFDGPVQATRIDISARRNTADIDARATVSGPLSKLAIDLSSTPALPKDEVLSRVLFSRSLAQLSTLEGAQLAAALNQLAGGQAVFDPAELLRGATGLDRIALGAGADASAIEAGKYITRNVYLQVGAGGEGGGAAEVEWQPQEDLSIVSTARGNGDTRIAVRWKKDY
jgi:translocation and assembly module TamB